MPSENPLADFRLELWAIDPENPHNDKLIDYSDSSADNIEHIYVQLDPDYSEYELVVIDKDGGAADVLYAVSWLTAAATEQTDDFRTYDLNPDGRVDALDLTVLMENMQSPQKDTGLLAGDINSDGKIDFADLRQLINKRGQKAEWFEK